MPTGSPDATPRSALSAILLDAGGVMIFPSLELLLPPLQAAGLQQYPADLERAHYRAMARCDDPGREPPGSQWWLEYLRDFAAACGVPADDVKTVAEDIAGLTRGFSWTHVGPGVGGALRGLAGLGVPLGIVSNSTGEVEQALRRLDVCFALSAGAAGAGVEVGVVIDSTVVGVSKPDPAIFALALDALGLPDVARSTVVHVGDSLRYDVAGALAAGIRPIHLDPHGYCPAPDGHEHIRRLSDHRPRGRALTRGHRIGSARFEDRCLQELGRRSDNAAVVSTAGLRIAGIWRLTSTRCRKRSYQLMRPRRRTGSGTRARPGRRASGPC